MKQVITTYHTSYQTLDNRNSKCVVSIFLMKNASTCQNIPKDFSQIPMSVVDIFDDPNDQLYMLNELTLSCINQHNPLRRVKLTHPPAPWMADLNIQTLQQKKDNQRIIANHSNKESDKQLYKDTKKQLKAEIKGTKKLHSIKKLYYPTIEKRYGAQFIEF